MATTGRFVWYELLTTDSKAARGFYTQVMNWKAEEFRGGEEPYYLWKAGDAAIGGVMEKKDMPSLWWAHVGVDDVDAVAARAETLGGRILVPGTEVPDVGRFALLTDPQGATIAIFKSKGDMPAPDQRKPGQVGWHELHTTDYEGAMRSYSELFGWKEAQTMDMGPAGKYVIFRHPGDKEDAWLGGMFNSPNVAPLWLYYVNLESMDAGVKRITGHGGTILNGPMDVPGGRAAQCRDPLGTMFAIFAAS